MSNHQKTYSFVWFLSLCLLVCFILHVVEEDSTSHLLIFCAFIFDLSHLLFVKFWICDANILWYVNTLFEDRIIQVRFVCNHKVWNRIWRKTNLFLIVSQKIIDLNILGAKRFSDQSCCLQAAHKRWTFNNKFIKVHFVNLKKFFKIFTCKECLFASIFRDRWISLVDKLFIFLIFIHFNCFSSADYSKEVVVF
jgi:hypothetical protein